MTSLQQSRTHFNPDHLCWESDYPHSDSSWPRAPETLVELFEGTPADLVAKITHRNAMTQYQFDPFRIRPKDRCTVGALRAESPDVDVVTRVGRPADESDLATWKQLTGARRTPR